MAMPPRTRVKVIDLLQTRPMSRRALVKASGGSQSMIQQIIVKLADHVFVSGWERGPRHWVEVYAWGCGPTPPRPPDFTNAEKCRRYKERRQQAASVFAQFYAQQLVAKRRNPRRDFPTPEPIEPEFEL